MPKNKGRGGKNYRRGKHVGVVKRDLLTKDADQGLQYGIAIAMLGNGRVKVKCFDQVDRIGHIRGKMKKKVWIATGDLIMCSLREQKQKCDIILKYSPDQIRQLKAMKEVPEDYQINENQIQGQSGIQFIDNDNDQDNSSDNDSSNSDDSDSDDGNDFLKRNKVENLDIDNI